MRARFVSLIAVGLVLAWSGSLWAADLTPAKVENFLKTWVELEKLTDSMPDEPMDEPMDEGEEVESGDLTADWTKSIVWDAQMKAVLSKYNYTPEEWMDTAGRVFGVYAAVKYDEAKVEMEADLLEAREEIEKDASLPPEQKKEILKNLEQSQASFQQALKNRPSEADMAVVKPFVPRMDEMFEAD
jgi:hypothetical protein